MSAKERRSTIRYDVAEEEVDEDVLEFVRMKLLQSADEWPEHLEPCPTDEDLAALLESAGGRFGAASRGVAIRACDDARKGMGAFAVLHIPACAVVGIYMGERLTARQHALRHGWRLEQVVANPTKQELLELKAREERLGALTSGVPISSCGVGARNGSAYCFSLFAEELKAALGSAMLPKHVAYIDGEDPNLSSWCRYVNHAPDGSVTCNLVPRVNALSCLVWLEATRDIEAGEELAFSYGDVYKWDKPPS